MPHTQEQPASSPLMIEYLLLALLSLLWGGSYGLIKLAVETITPVTLVAVRVAIAAAFLWCFVLITRKTVPTDRKTWLQFFVQALIGFVIPFTMITWGQQYVESGLAGILNSTTPIFVFLAAALWLGGEAASRERAFGVIAGLGGVSLLIGIEAFGGLGQHVAGQLAITGATISYAAAMIYGKRFRAVAPDVTAASTLSIAALVLIPAAFAVETPLSLAPTSTSVLSLVALAILCTAGAFVLYFRLVNTLGSVGTSSVAYARAAISVVFGTLLLGESFGPTEAIGMTAVLVGVVAINGQLFALFARRKSVQVF